MREVTYRKKKSKKGIIIGALVGLLALAALVIFGLFRVQEVVISGNSIYSAAEIQKAIMQDGLCKNTLYLLWKYQDDSKVEESLPFLSSLEVEMLAPYRVQIRVYEKPEIGCFLSGTDYIYFDRDGLIVGISKEVHEGVPLINGVALGKYQRYEKLPIEDEKVRDGVVELTQLLSKNELKPKEIKFDDKGSITLYFENVKVLMGSDQDMNEKVAALKSVYDKISSMEGTLHMETFTTDSQTITFKQGETEESLKVENGSSGEKGGEGQGESGDGEEDGDSQTGESGGPTYSESDGTFSTDAQGNTVYTDAMGNTTTNTEQYNYTDESGNIITDGYGYIDPYTGAYIIK